jgi:MFS family permease
MTRDAPVPIGTTITTNIPTRLDRLPWSRWHWGVVIALGITWILDGLEASLLANLGPVLQEKETLALSPTDVGAANTAYLLGQVTGALIFGRLTDQFGRKKLFLVTLAVYLAATALSGLAPDFGVFVAFRFVAGSGIGGEYSAINSAIDELVPAALRGRVDLAVNGSYWVGVALGGVTTEVLLDSALVPHAVGWRLVFLLGAAIGLLILVVRRNVPESPRWLLTHGRVAESERVVSEIEASVTGSRGVARLPDSPAVTVQAMGSVGVAYVARLLLERHRRRTLLGAALMIGQSIFYNAIFFSAAMILSGYLGVPADQVGRYMIPFAAGNFLGPTILGRLFDTVGRRRMIAATYLISGVLLLATGYAFREGWLSARTQTLSWSVVFFFASAAASSAYLTVSELFPVEIRGQAIALFYAFATAVGSLAPAAFGALVKSGSRAALFQGYVVVAAVMSAAGVVAALFGVDAEGKSLEQLASPDA